MAAAVGKLTAGRELSRTGKPMRWGREAPGGGRRLRGEGKGQLLTGRACPRALVRKALQGHAVVPTPQPVNRLNNTELCNDGKFNVKRTISRSSKKVN